MYTLGQIKEGKTRVFVCASTTVHRWMRLGLKLNVREEN
eukprot:COSAG02_NODE_41324_length_395_cov_13.929054_1_plen_38_part_10